MPRVGSKGSMSSLSCTATGLSGISLIYSVPALQGLTVHLYSLGDVTASLTAPQLVSRHRTVNISPT